MLRAPGARAGGAGCTADSLAPVRLPPPFARLRPRGLFLTAMIAVVAVLVWRGAGAQRQAGSAEVAAWLRDRVIACQDRPDAVPPLGVTEPVVASSFAAWVRGALPEGVAGEASVAVTPVAGGLLGAGSGEATHRAVLRLRGAAAEADVHWAEGGAAIVAFRPGVPGR